MASQSVGSARNGAIIPAWLHGSSFTVGVEDELLLVDEKGQLLGEQASPVMAALLRHEALRQGAAKGEIFLDEAELETPVCTNAEDIFASLRTLRASLTDVGGLAMAVGLHPTAGFGEAHISESSRYDRIGQEFAGLLRTPTAAFQVHVGLPDPNAAILAYRGLRNRLAVFRALAAGSPYWHGRDSGHACVRPAILRSYPRTTMPPRLRTWEDYVETIERQMWAGDVPEYTYVCWELRPQPRLGTVEVRVMDAQHSIERAAGLTALVQGLARRVVEAPDEADLPDDVLIANDHQACRYGLEGTIVHWDGSRQPMRKVAEAALEEASAMLKPDNFDGPLESVRAILNDPPEYVRQRRLVERRGMPALLSDLVARTADPAS